MNRVQMIKRLRNCVVPERYANYSIKWYDTLSDKQLIMMCNEIKVDGPDEEEDKPRPKVIQEERSPYKYDKAKGEYVVLTDSGKWETVYE